MSAQLKPAESESQQRSTPEHSEWTGAAGRSGGDSPLFQNKLDFTLALVVDRSRV